MSEESNYGTKRQLKAIKSRGKRHSSTISGNVWGVFPDALDIPSPEKERHDHQRGSSKKMIDNMTISIDLDVKDNTNPGLLKRLESVIGADRVDKDFEVLSTAEMVLRAFAKAKFKNVVRIELDGLTLYENPDDYYDLDKSITMLINQIHKQKEPAMDLQMQLTSMEFFDVDVDVHISRHHRAWTHDMLIKMSGELPEEYFRRVINYLEGHLDIENIENEWSGA